LICTRFLGHRVFPDFRLLQNANVRRFRKRLKRMLAEYFSGRMSKFNFYQRMRSWWAYAAFSDTWRLRKKI
jgi:hypothetical protein